eukprot:4682425-Pleurochrysis_carterae.AAC.1
MSYHSLRDAAHFPPPEYDFSEPWRCSHCEKKLFVSWADFHAQKTAHEELRESAEAGDEAAEKLYNKIMSEHAEMHLDQMKFVPPVLEVGTDVFIVDALHCLQLNVAKTAWKYSFGNKMDEHARERASEYMESI